MKALLRLRLSLYFWLLLSFFLVVNFSVRKMTFNSAALTLFSVNSFLYGFYLAPILSAQKGRIEELTKQVRAEATALFKAMILTKKLPDAERSDIQALIGKYLRACVRERSVAQGEKEYEAIITFCLEYDGKNEDTINKIMDIILTNQQNRVNVSMQLGNKVFSNEWMIILVLFSITTGFILFLDAGQSMIFKFIASFLCTGLSMLLIILAKLNLLMHKKANQVWRPYEKLLISHFYRID